ncbi:hypothetical protein HMPREF9333_00185 [Johnsonella ignava ATCC 51276]|jgi:putative RNA-binding protein, yhbY family|uniref:CRM domain-containing protein n=1 Tax=Johnsonella ignava ATCC 51276 TaxID=679200 RepID=G5GF47_9FIRM|nr:ribosome assembly RNA-binding protein YhbY [Johnsonella ignava]EHI56738.1 hypothetical protein HMPREF9333_00185 [Johnsonella ignava ATCC 51276]
MNSRQRAYLKGLAMVYEAIFNIGKQGITDEVIEAVKEALEAKELIKLSVLKNCTQDLKSIADEIASCTRSDVVQVIGRKIILYKQADEPKNRKIILPD